MSRRDAIASGLAAVERRIELACARVGRDRSEVRLVAVSKMKPASDLRIAWELGQREFGENYVQELVEKSAEVEDLPGIRFRLIGHLQRKKARVVVRTGAAVDTVDSVPLAEALARRADLEAQRIEILLQVNVAGDPRKSGCAPAELGILVKEVRRFDALDVRGLFTVPPVTEGPEGARPFFRELRALAGGFGLPELSMGMSHDLEVAVEEGATLVRIGTAIFGAR